MGEREAGNEPGSEPGPRALWYIVTDRCVPELGCHCFL